MQLLIGTMKYCLEMPHYLDEHLTGVTKVLPELSKTQTSKALCLLSKKHVKLFIGMLLPPCDRCLIQFIMVCFYYRMQRLKDRVGNFRRGKQ